MSRYLINKLMLAVDDTQAVLDEYLRDPAAFVADWEEREGVVLTPEGRAAFASRDYETLYALGGHPYILWQFVRSVYVPHEMSAPELAEAFRRAAEPHGHPDYAT